MSGYRHCITENSADRQRQFENALLTLMNQKPLNQISIQDICGQVSLSRKSFYRYFSSKEACLEALVDHTILAFTDLSYLNGGISRMLEQFFLYWSQHTFLLDGLSRNHLENLLYERAMICASQEYGIRDYFFHHSGNYEQAIFFISGLFGLLLHWHADGCRKTPEQIAAAMITAMPPHSRGVFQ